MKNLVITTSIIGKEMFACNLPLKEHHGATDSL